ncbi:LuxR C-terminal-related transcriptional regulator [Rhodococcus sp. NPDC058514]|uniref:LuxR C-terminal-related transcriptional regulator n=1 Tax=unclassified Rhodococcus (in: high G+C Gram-positive bacteria) TaxID=192944 RepID=UPI00365AF4AC
MASRALAQGRNSFLHSAWADAYSQLSAADSDRRLGPEDTERLAVAAELIGNADESSQAWERAHRDWLGSGEIARAARCAFWLGMGLVQRGEMARGGGWFSRAGRLLAGEGLECAERGYLLIPAALQSIGVGDLASATANFDEAARIGARFEDTDLVALSRLGLGQCLVCGGRVAEGMVFLDEAMIAVTSGETNPIATGIIYCAVILACQDVFDLHRAQEWTEALDRWSGPQPGLVPFRGQCLVHRSQLMQLRGAWADALAEARLARDRLSAPYGQPAVGMAFYQLAELHRLRGEFDEAEEAYRAAGEWAREPQPGLALLWLAQGRLDAALNAIRRVLDEGQDRTTRSKMLPAFVDIALSAGQVPAARQAADELSQIAVDLDAPLLHAISARATGAVLLAEGEARAAAEELRRSWRIWQDLEAPYEVAQVRVLIGLAYRELGDVETANSELAAAAGVFERLGAGPDLARVQRLSTKGATAEGGLTGRELQVLALAATGKTNREIAEELVLSEHTIRRHLQNVFTKIGVSSRAAATAYAFRHDLV